MKVNVKVKVKVKASEAAWKHHKPTPNYLGKERAMPPTVGMYVVYRQMMEY